MPFVLPAEAMTPSLRPARKKERFPVGMSRVYDRGARTGRILHGIGLAWWCRDARPEDRRLSNQLMIYGAYGFTGDLVARHALDIGIRPLIAGRDPDKTARLADELGLDHVCVDIADADAFRDALAHCAAVVNCAGPFLQTWEPVTSACLETATHYLDITGEIPVFEGCARLDAAAEAAGITIMPGVGFDVVPTDCMASMLRHRLPDATSITLAFKGMAQASRGTARTSIPFLAKAPTVRRNGTLTDRKGAMSAKIDFGDGPERVYAISWGDVATAWYTTGIPNIEVFLKPPPDMVPLLRLPAPLRGLLMSRIGSVFVRSQLRRMPSGPDARQRAKGRCVVLGRAGNERGDVVELLLETPDGYQLTGALASVIGGMAADHALPTGFQTPARALGAEFILQFDGCAMRD